MTIKDIARESGYAVGTVSRVLNNNPRVSEDARRKILAVVAQHGYQPNANAKHLKQQVPEGLALIVKGTQNALFADLLDKLQQTPFASNWIRAGSPLISTIRSRAIRPIWTTSSLLKGWGKMTTSKLVAIWSL